MSCKKETSTFKNVRNVDTGVNVTYFGVKVCNIDSSVNVTYVFEFDQIVTNDGPYPVLFND